MNNLELNQRHKDTEAQLEGQEKQLYEMYMKHPKMNITDRILVLERIATKKAIEKVLKE